MANYQEVGVKLTNDKQLKYEMLFLIMCQQR